MRKLLLSLLSILFFCSSLYASAPLRITLQATISSQTSGLLHNETRSIRVAIFSHGASRPIWNESISNVSFINGTCSIILGTNEPLTAEHFDIDNPVIRITLLAELGANGRPESFVEFPVPSTPYAVLAKLAETVKSLDASKIAGTFTSTLNINADMNVGSGVLFIDNGTRRVGVGTTEPAYDLDVAGIINAEEFRIEGRNIEDVLSWQKNGQTLFYNAGRVGIATANPQFTLDVAGTINAREFRINSVLIEDYLDNGLPWKNAASGNDIYFNDGRRPGNVGIGTTTPTAKLDVNGGLRVGRASSPALPGTIQYADDDFYGFVDGKGYVSLTGVEGSGGENRIVIWSGEQSVTSSEKLVWDIDEEFMGIGTPTPDALLSIKGESEDENLFIIRDSSDEVLFQISSQNVGIGTNSANALLTVDGVVDADNFLINGQPIFQAINPSSFWRITNFGRMIYDKGNVGIGTASPQNLLELASAASSNPVLTFSTYQNNVPVQLYSMGIDYRTPDTFIISRGGDLEQPVFAFNRERIGVGLTNPSTNLQVSGNSGVLFVGDLDSGGTMDVAGEGTRFMFHASKGAVRAGHITGQQWDEDNIGRFSVGFGYNSLADGEATVVGGGLGNQASGNYAVVPGGILNRALADYTFAAGHEAVARHEGSFVWSDYTPTSDISSFLSSAKNQFVVRANNGMGINTTDTVGTALTIHKETLTGYLLRAKGNADGENAFVVTTSGNAGIGTSDPGIARLAVMDGRVGIGTTQPTATLTVSHNLTEGFAYIAYKEDGTPAIFIRHDGKIGIGYPLDHHFDPDESLAIAGVLKTVDVFIRDDTNPDGFVRLEPNPGSPWSVPNTENQTFYTRGNVGIGTTDPRSLLELSNVSGNFEPVITFDIDGTDVFSMGVTRDFFTIQTGGTLNATNPTFTMSQAGVGIGLGYQPASASLHVNGDVILSGNVAIGTTNVRSNFPLLIDATMNVQEFWIRGQEFIPQPTPWLDNFQTQSIYYPGNVGIGTSDPQARLDVNGAVSVNSLTMTSPFTLRGNIAANQLELRDLVATFNKYYYVNVLSGELGFVDPSTNIRQELSSPLQATENIQVKGPLSYWVDRSSLGETDIYWDQSKRELSLTGNMIVNIENKIAGGVGVSSSISMTSDTALDLSTTINHDGDLRTVTEYTGQKVRVNIASNWGHRDEVKEIRGLDIKMTQTDPTARLLNQARAIGLEVDVSDVNVDANSDAYKAAAVFLGGNVGIGVTNPSSTLEVAGIVSANFFNLSGGLNVPQLAVNTDALVAYKDIVLNRSRVGVGTTDPQAELHVIGTVSANSAVLSGGLQTATVNIGNGAFFVNASGNIGIGTTSPNGQIHIEKTLSTPGLLNYTGEKIVFTIDGTNNDNQTFFLDSNLVGMDINMSTEQGNLISESAVGVSINFNDLELAGQSTAVGLDIDVSGSGGTRYAALFNGGRVGIGTTQPLAELHVSGDIVADNLYLEGSLIADAATFNNLVLRNGNFSGHVTMNSVSISGTLTANRIVLTTPLVANEGTFSTLNATIASINEIANIQDLIISNAITGNRAQFSAVGIGIPAPTQGLAVSGNFTSDRVTITELLNLTTATMNINNSLFVHSNGNVGIGTNQPTAPLHIQYTAANSFNPEVNNSWNAIRIQTLAQTDGSSAGIILAPDSRSPSATVGSGIIGIRSGSGSRGASHLAFVTDPTTGVPQERMRISDLGNVGIGTTQPGALLDVNGTAIVQGTATVNTIFVSRIESPSTLTINAGNGDIQITGQVSANSAILANAGIRIKAGTPTPSPLAGYGSLYVNQLDNHLYYMKPSGASVNISAPLTGRPKAIPFYNAQGQLDDTAQLTWDNTSKQLTVGSISSSNFSTMIVNTLLDNSVTSNVSLQDYTLHFGNRTQGANEIGDNVFTGVNISFESDNAQDPINFGRLANNELAVGIYVDMSSLKSKQTTAVSSSPVLQGFKYAAAFLGGSVGIGTTRPDAQVHISQEVTGNPVLRIDTLDNVGTARTHALVVSQNGLVGLNTAAPTAQLHVVNSSASQPIITIDNASDTTVFAITNAGNMGIGTANPTSKVEVIGTVAGTTGSFGGLTATTMNIGSDKLVVNTSGNVGIHTNAPSASLHIFDQLTSSTPVDTLHIGQKTELRITGGTEDNPFRFNQDVIGLSTKISSTGSNTIGNTQSATGLQIDLSSMVAGAQTTVRGLEVDVTGTGGTRYAASFMGGNVGIGTTTPTSALHVSGDIQAKGLTLTGSLSAGSITGTSMNLSGTATANALTASSISAQTISANNLILTGTITVATANVTTLNASIASINRLGIGLTNPAAELHVSGNTIISGNLTATTLNATFLNAESGFTMVGTDATFTGTVVVTGDIQLNNGALLFATQNVQAADATYGMLYARPDGHLMYNKPAGASVNLTAALSGTANTLAYYNSSGQLDSTSLVSWIDSQKTFHIGTSENTTRFEIVTTINANTTGNIAAERIRLAYQNRTQLLGTSTKGLEISFTSVEGETAVLGQEDIAIGLVVDVSGIQASQTSVGPTDGQSRTDGRKAAAAFIGGSVGIGTSDPSASLDVVSISDTRPMFTVGKDNSGTIVAGYFHITNTGLVGVGTTSPEALLDVRPKTGFAGDYIFSASTIGANKTFVIDDQGNTGIGFAFPSANLHLKGTNPFKIDSNTTEGLFGVYNGNVGIGTATPTAQLTVSGNNSILFRAGSFANPNVLVAKNNNTVGIGTSNPGHTLTVSGNVLVGSFSQGGTPPSFFWANTTQGLMLHKGTSAANATAFFGVTKKADPSTDHEATLFWKNVGNSATNSGLLFIQENSSGTSAEVMRLTDSGRLGVGITVPTAVLHLTGDMIVDTTGQTNALFVSSNGNVGIHTNDPSANLHVKGTLMADQLTILQDSVSVTTLNVSKEMTIVRTLTQNISAIAHDIQLDLSQDIGNNLTGLNLRFNSLTNEEEDRPYSLNGATAIGMRVDMTALDILDPNVTAKKYAATFLGGNVGIGITEASAPLEVRGPFLGNIARFGTSGSELTFKDYDTGTIAFEIRTLLDGVSDGTTHQPLVLSNGNVGIGVTNPTKKLNVDGDIRVGLLRTSATELGSAASGAKLIFSGVAADDDNSREVFMTRHNTDPNASELRVSVGDGTVTDNFVVGYDDGGTFTPIFRVIPQNNAHPTRVGVDGTGSSFIPSATFHVLSEVADSATNPANHAVVFENNGGDDADSLVIWHTHYSAAGDSVPTESNFITFADATTVLGEIEGNGSNGVRFKTNGADYAEYLPKRSKDEVIEKGDIVSVVNGKISKNTEGFHQLMVRSSAASIAGNWPGKDKETDYELIAFFGQVKIKVIGAVEKGDYILPSGQHDGSGVAVSPDKLAPADFNRIVGRAWESDSGQSMKLIHAAVGFNFNIPSLKTELGSLDTIEKDLETLKTEQEKLQSDFETTYKAREAEINALLEQLN